MIQQHGGFDLLQQSTLDRKKKNFTFSRKFPFMKSKDDKNEDGSDQERKSFYYFLLANLSYNDIQCTISAHSLSKINYFYFLSIYSFSTLFQFF